MEVNHFKEPFTRKEMNEAINIFTDEVMPEQIKNFCPKARISLL